MIKYILTDGAYVVELELDQEIQPTQRNIDHLVQVVKDENNIILDHTVAKLICMTGKHYCKYCGEIVDGPDEDVLCKGCRELFGHSFYSEL